MDWETSAQYSLLEHMLLDERAEPADLPLLLLRAITNNFSDDQEIGRGGFAAVYKGLLRNGMIIAVKKLSQSHDMDDKKFIQEVRCLMRVKHKNIVRFLGYCSDTHGKMLDYEGENVMADVRERLLCFEYLPNGSLDKYIKERPDNRANSVVHASHELEWRTCYQIIKGTCEGLLYLHQKRILHLDLKPANILLDHDMVPKIADFGLSRCFDEKQSQHLTQNAAGTLGYVAPEVCNGVITFKSDVYSLGVTIMEILAGQKGYSPVENVIERWRNRLLGTSLGGTLLQHVRVCAEIGIKCIDHNPEKRPSIQSIVEMLHETESRDYFVKIGMDNLSLSQDDHAHTDLQQVTMNVQRQTSYEVSHPGFTRGGTDLLYIYPLELYFSFKPNSRILCPVSIVNRTDDYVFYLIRFGETKRYLDTQAPCSNVLEPRSTFAFFVAMLEQQQPPSDMGKFEIITVTLKSDLYEDNKIQYYQNMMLDDGFLKKLVEYYKGEMRSVTLVTIASCDPARDTMVFDGSTVSKTIMWEDEGDNILRDLHPTKPWILTIDGRYITIWNYETQAKVVKLKTKKTRPSLLHPTGIYRALFLAVQEGSSTLVAAVKFIARKQWLVAGDTNGYITVYSTVTMEETKTFYAHRGYITSMEVHPTDPLLLSSSLGDRAIKLWNWDMGWSCTRTFELDSDGIILKMRFNPSDSTTFASRCAEYDAVQMWTIFSDFPNYTLRDRTAVDYLETDDRQYLVTTQDRKTELWALHAWSSKQHHVLTSKCDHPWNCYYNFIACHPTLPIIVSGHCDGIIRIWNSYRVEKMVRLMLGDIRRVAFIKTISSGRCRFVVDCKKGLAIVDTELTRLTEPWV